MAECRACCYPPNAADAVDLGTTNSSDAIIRQGTCLKADFAATAPSAWPDMTRLTTTTGTTDNVMGGFGTFIDGYATWQPADPFMGLDHAGCPWTPRCLAVRE